MTVAVTACQLQVIYIFFFFVIGWNDLQSVEAVAFLNSSFQTVSDFYFLVLYSKIVTPGFNSECNSNQKMMSFFLFFFRPCKRFSHEF